MGAHTKKYEFSYTPIGYIAIYELYVGMKFDKNAQLGKPTNFYVVVVIYINFKLFDRFQNICTNIIVLALTLKIKNLKYKNSKKQN